MALLVSMVVSLTIIPVLAARFLGRRPMPTTGPIYNLLADRYEGLLKVGLRFPRSAVLLALLAVVPGLVALPDHLETGFMPEMDEGAFVLDYNMPVGTSLAQTDKVLRRVEAVLLRTPGHLRLHPPDRGRTRLLRHRALHRRHPREPEAVGPAPPDDRDRSTSLREELKAEVPELETEFVPLVQDQIGDLAGVDSRSRSRSSGRTVDAPRAGRDRSARSSRRSTAWST